MDKNIIFDKLRKVVHSVQTKEQLHVAIRYAERAAKCLQEDYLIGAHLDFALRTHPALLFKPFPPPATLYRPGGIQSKYYNLDADYLTGMLWQ
jgi:hypothetical protein